MFDKNVILKGGKELQYKIGAETVHLEGLTSLWETRHGQIFVNSKLDLDTDGVPLAQIRMDVDHQDETALKNPDGTSLNSFEIPYIVVPLGFLNYLETQGIHVAPGAMGIVQYKGHSVPVILADLGPRFKIGEGSAYLREQLGFKVVADGHVIDDGIESGVDWVLFPGTGNGKGRTRAEIDAVVAGLSKEL